MVFDWIVHPPFWLHTYQIWTSILFGILNHFAQNLNQGLVQLFSLTVSLKMIWCNFVVIDLENFNHGFNNLIQKMFSFIINEDFGTTKLSNHVFIKEDGYGLSIIHFDRFGFCPFNELLCGHDDEFHGLIWVKVKLDQWNWYSCW